MDPFEFVLSLVAIVTAGGIITTIVKTVGSAFARPPHAKPIAAPPQAEPAEVALLREVVDQVSGRVAHLEEERDFYKDLLESPGARAALRAPDVQKGASDTYAVALDVCASGRGEGVASSPLRVRRSAAAPPEACNRCRHLPARADRRMRRQRPRGNRHGAICLHVRKRSGHPFRGS